VWRQPLEVSVADDAPQLFSGCVCIAIAGLD
jgi:hypothetical protein